MHRGWILITILMVLAANLSAAAQAAGDDTVTFTDPVLQAVMEAKTGRQPVTRQAMARLTGTLDLTFQGISTVEGLQYATGITALLLTGNAIASADQLTALSGLQRLDLDYNPLESLPADMSGLESITELHLGGTRLTVFPQGVTTLPRLRRLYMEDITPQGAPGDLSALADSLNRLFLSGTAFSDWSFLGALSKLELLDMQGCGLTALPSSIESLAGLRYLYLQHNDLETLPAWIGNLPKLERLDLTGNRLYTLPDSMASLAKLKHLVLSDNEFFTLPGWITKLTGLEVLLMSNNHLSKVPDGFSKLGRLYRFSFQNNNLTSIASVGRISVGYPYQVSFKYNLLNLSDAATADLLRYYNKAGTQQKTPITAKIMQSDTLGVQVSADFDVASHDSFLSADCTVEAPRLYRLEDDGVYHLAATGEYSREYGVALVTDRYGLDAGMNYQYQLVIPVILPDGTRVFYQAAASVERLSAYEVTPLTQTDPGILPEPVPTPEPEPVSRSGGILALVIVITLALAALIIWAGRSGRLHPARFFRK